MHRFYCCVNMKRPISHLMGFRVPHRYQCTCVLQEVGNIINDLDGPLRASVEALAMGKLRFLTFKYLATNLFWKCWDENWLFNSHMWMVWVLKPTLCLGKTRLLQLKNTIQHWMSRKSQETTEWLVVVKQLQKIIYNRENKHKHTIMLNT